jgi:AraC-like DNA-binding protein
MRGQHLGYMAQSSSQWTLTSHTLRGHHLRAYRYDPHLHDTYTIAFMSRGNGDVQVRGVPSFWSSRSVFLANPYEVHEGRSRDPDAALEYEVFYPSVELILEALGISKRTPILPRFQYPIVVDPVVIAELSDILSYDPDGTSVRASARQTNTAIEESLIRFIRRHASLLTLTTVRDQVKSVERACRILQEAEADDATVSLSELAAQVGVSRYHFIRLFHRVTGLAPNAYLRQIKLSKARRLICEGAQLAEAAAQAGFADQAHLTREFKRVFGTTPGKIARDLRPQTLCGEWLV